MENVYLTEAENQLSPELQNYYTVNKQWLSEINFFEDEMRFMKQLLDKFFINLMKDAYVNRIQLIKMQLTSLGFVKNNVKEDILTHQHNIEARINNTSAKSDFFLHYEDEKIADEVKDLHKSFRRIKSEIYVIAGDLLNSLKQIKAGSEIAV